MDMPTTGALYTWDNGRHGAAKIEMHLDRALFNEAVLQDWRVSCVALPRHRSDHYPIMFDLNPLVVGAARPFKFLSIWTKHPNCRRVIQEVWRKQAVGCPMYVLSLKLKILKGALKLWNKQCFGDVRGRVREATARLKSIQFEDPVDQEREMQAHLELDRALLIEEEFWRTKARIQWHCEGTAIPLIFTGSLSFVEARSTLLAYLEMSRYCSQTLTESEVLSYFQGLYAPPINNVDPSPLIQKTISSRL